MLGMQRTLGLASFAKAVVTPISCHNGGSNLLLSQP